MFLAMDGDITAAEARFLGRLAGAGSCGGGERGRERGRAEVEREKVDGGLSGEGGRGGGEDGRERYETAWQG